RRYGSSSNGSSPAKHGPALIGRDHHNPISSEITPHELPSQAGGADPGELSKYRARIIISRCVGLPHRCL
ncbi:hypothetical protein BaRGS_00017182, partial [Batillaria attramentaria]